jgi:hypothetical protein
MFNIAIIIDEHTASEDRIWIVLVTRHNAAGNHQAHEQPRKVLVWFPFEPGFLGCLLKLHEFLRFYRVLASQAGGVDDCRWWSERRRRG